MPMVNARYLQIVYGTLGLAGFFAVWQVIGHYQLAGLSWPPLSAVLYYLFDPDRHALFFRAIDAMLFGFVCGFVPEKRDSHRELNDWNHDRT